jgi:hypothetical protein
MKNKIEFVGALYKNKYFGKKDFYKTMPIMLTEKDGKVFASTWNIRIGMGMCTTVAIPLEGAEPFYVIDEYIENNKIWLGE